MISINFISYFFALFSVCSIWLLDSKTFAAILFALAIFTGHTVGIVSFTGLVVTVIYFALNFVYFKTQVRTEIKILLWILIFVLAFSLSSGWINGFHSWKIISAEIVSPQGKPYDLILHFDEIIASMGIILFSLSPARKAIQYLLMIRQMLPFCLIIIPSLMFFVIVFKVVKLDPKVPDFWLIWLMANLLITCVVEETIFRFFMQRTISKILASYKFCVPLAIFVPSIFYAIYYMPIPISSYITLVLISCSYGYVYHITKRLEASIIFHIVCNALHFFTFTYPQMI